MSKIRSIALFILSLSVFVNSAFAQNPVAAGPSQAAPPAVTASVSGVDGVRFAAPGQVLQIRVEIYSASGALVSDSGLRAGNIVDWKVSDASQALTDGQYLTVVTVRDFQGKYRQRVGGVTVQSGQVTLKNPTSSELTAAQSQTLNARRESQKVEAADNSDVVTILRDGKERAVVVTGHDGQEGQVAVTTGPLTFRTGDFFSNRAKEQMRIMPDGRVGIGTSDPQATLDVAGTIRARGGIVFDDGSVLKSAPGAGTRTTKEAVEGSGTVVPAATGSGTVNQLAKWADNAGTLGNSLISESNGNVGIGTTSPSAMLQVNATAPGFNDLLKLTSADNSGGTGAARLRVSQQNSSLVINAYTSGAPGVLANSAGFFADNAVGTGTNKLIIGHLGTSVGNDLTFFTNNQYTNPQMVLTQAGNVGIGTTSPSATLQVNAAAPGFNDLLKLTSDDKSGGAGAARLRVSQQNSSLVINAYTSGAPGVLANSAGFFADNTVGTGTNKLIIGHTGMSAGNDIALFTNNQYTDPQMILTQGGNVGIGTTTPTQRMEVAGNLKVSGAGNGLIFPDGTKQTTAAGGGGSMTGTAIVTAINDAATAGVISEARLSPNVAKLNAQNNWTGQNTFNGLSMNGTNVVNLANPVSATDATNKAYVDANFIKFVPGAEQLSVGDANGTAPMINLRGGSTCCSGPGGHTPAFFKVFQNGSFVATGNLGIGTSPMEGKGYRTSWHTYKGAFRSGYADNEWDDANVGFFSWAGGSNSTASGLYALAFGDTNSAESTSSIVFGSGNQVKGAAGFSAGAGNRVCDTYGVALGNNAKSGGPYINGKCDPDSFNLRGLAAVAIGYNVTADQDHTTAMGKFASNNGFTGTFVWSDGSAQASADTFRNTANNEFAARATGGFRFRTNLGGTTGCNLPAGSGVFNCTSSRATKENFLMTNGEDVLSKLRKVPVSSWNYISEGKSTRHMGPMAEDFYQAFNLGTGSASIGVQDLTGVSLAAIKALDQRTSELQQKTVEVEQLRTQVNELRAMNSAIEQRLAALEQNVKRPVARKTRSRR